MLGVSGVVAVLGAQDMPPAVAFRGAWAVITIAALAAAVAAMAIGRIAVNRVDEDEPALTTAAR